jgi:hypothetical protein
MPFETLHFRGSDKILKEKKMTREIKLTMEYLNDCLFGTYHKGELLRQALQEMDWRQNGDLNVLDGRRYFYKGMRNRVAMDGSFSSYEYIQDALLKLQVGFDKIKIDMGIVLVTSQRSEKSKLGTTKDLVCQEIEMLYPTISLPVTIVLFDLGKPGEPYIDAKTSAAPVANDGTVKVQNGDKDKDKVELPNDLDVTIENKREVLIDPKSYKGLLNNNPEPGKQTGKKKNARKKTRADINPDQNESSSLAVNQ